MEVEIISVDELNISANQQHAFILVMPGRAQAKHNEESDGFFLRNLTVFGLKSYMFRECIKLISPWKDMKTAGKLTSPVFQEQLKDRCYAHFQHHIFFLGLSKIITHLIQALLTNETLRPPSLRAQFLKAHSEPQLHCCCSDITEAQE